MPSVLLIFMGDNVFKCLIKHPIYLTKSSLSSGCNSGFRESTLSSSVTRKDARLVLEGYNLTLQGVTTRDQGEYICEVQTLTICTLTITIYNIPRWRRRRWSPSARRTSSASWCLPPWSPCLTQVPAPVISHHVIMSLYLVILSLCQYIT